jgi:hypothetical protein
MPAMMGSGFLKRAARIKASNWVLSPISASATTPVEISKDSKITFYSLHAVSEKLYGPALQQLQSLLWI